MIKFDSTSLLLCYSFIWIRKSRFAIYQINQSIILFWNWLFMLKSFEFKTLRWQKKIRSRSCFNHRTSNNCQKKNFNLIAVENNFKRQRWQLNEISIFFYNKLIHKIINVNKQTKHDRIYDRHYKIHKYNIDTFFFKIIKLKDFIIFSMQIELENIIIFMINFSIFLKFRNSIRWFFNWWKKKIKFK